MGISTVILDFDGTLASTVESIHLCMSETMKIFGFSEPSMAEVKKTVGLTLEESMRRLTNNGCDEASIPKMVATYRDLHNKKAAALTSLFDGTLETLVFLRSLGIQSILVSNKGRQGLNHLAEHLKIKDYLDVILSAEDVKFRKPDARLFNDSILPILSNSKPDEVLVIGDTESDLLFAKNAGIKSCWASYGYGDQDKCRSLEPNFMIGTIKELQTVLQK